MQSTGVGCSPRWIARLHSSLLYRLVGFSVQRTAVPGKRGNRPFEVLERNIKWRPYGVDFHRRSLRSDRRQGSRPAARRSARASLRVLDCFLAPASVFPWGSGRSPFPGCARFRFCEFSLVLEVMPSQKNRSARPVGRNFWARREGRPFWSRVWVLASIPTERNALNG
jgi:hypothetical protein